MMILIRTVFLLLVLFGGIAPAIAQPPAKPQQDFVPIDQLPTPERFPAAPLVVAAYAVIWVAVFVYVWLIWRRLNRVERELQDVARRLEAGRRP